MNGPVQLPDSLVELRPYCTLVSCAEFGAGAVKVTWIAPLYPIPPLLSVAAGVAGWAGGAVPCTAGVDCGLCADGPAALVARTVYSYQVPLLLTVNDCW